MIGYVVASTIAIIMGQVVAHLIASLMTIVEKSEKPKYLIEALKKTFKLDYIYSLVLLIVFNAIIYFAGNDYMSYVYMLVFLFLTVVFVIDYKMQLIPDTMQIVLGIIAILNIGIRYIFNIGELTKTIEFGEKIISYPYWLDCVCGAIIGGGIFYILAILAKVIYKKEGMGFGDVKLMTALGGLFGVTNILGISVLSFFIGAIMSILLMLFKVKSMEDYIPFGPFIVIASLLVALFTLQPFYTFFYNMCSFIGNFFTDIIFKITGG